MDFTCRRLGCALVAFLGLASSPFVFAQQSAALAACQADNSSFTDHFLGLISNQNNPSVFCVASEPSCSPHSRIASGELRHGYALHVTWGYADRTVPCKGMGSMVSYPSLFVSDGMSGFNRYRYQSGNPSPPPYGGGEYYFYWSDGEEEPDPDPDPFCEAGKEVLGVKAPTPSGTGSVCVSGCLAQISKFSTPPLYRGSLTGSGCAAATPDPLPSEDHELPDDPDAPGTNDPSDPDAPPDTGGGGFTCDQPPVCNADGVTCSMLYQQWRTRCDADLSDIDRNEKLDRIGDTLDNGFGVITDDIMGLGDRLGQGLGDVVDRLDGTNARLDGIGQTLDHIRDGMGDVNAGVGEINDKLDDVFGDGSVGDDWVDGLPVEEKVFDSSSLDDTGMGLSRSCPVALTQSTSFSFFGNTYSLNFDMFCDMLELVGQILVVLAAFVGVRILLRSTTGG